MKLQSSFALSILLALGLAAAPSLRAQVGNNNPTGPAGSFNGAVTTGGSYDPFTGNATRSITDIVVPGAVGEYPLAFTRTTNSRDTSWDFGSAGAWRHSYNWQMEDSLAHSNPFFSPNYYGVTFPDGRVIYFTQSGTDPYFRGPPGVQERFQPLNTTTLLAYLILPDGGKVEFQATRIPPECDYELIPPCTYGYTYKAAAIIDPYGLRTVLAYNGDGTLNTITEPAGRWLQLVYTTTPWTNGYGFHDLVIDHVTSSDGRSVQYNYGLQTLAPGTIAFTYLGNVVYYGDSSLLASYSYQAPNMAPFNGPPLLSTASDPMYAGPMKSILYTYATGLNGDNSTPVFGQIRYEKSIDGQTVSNLGVIVSGRVETKGDGSSRYFTFPASGYLLSSWSDFVNLRYANKQYDANNFLQAFTDRNSNTTNFVCDAITGRPTQATYPLTSSDVALAKPRATVQYVYGSPSCPDPNNQIPYYLYSYTDERNNTTIYLRDVNHRVTQINYPNGGIEAFTYNSFGQVLTHRLRTGGLETFSYDARGLLTQYRDAYHLATVDPQNPTVPANATPSFSYTYYTSGPWLDRLQTITDANAKVTTFNQYNSRGQLVKKTHPLGQGESIASNIQAGYSTDGTIQWKQNELGHRTSYAYDDYKRLISVTLPPRAAGSPSPTPTLIYYDHNGGTSTTDYSHTDANAWRVTLPSQKIQKTVYNSNLLKTAVTMGHGTADAATTTYAYDYNGNVKTVKNPNGQATGLYTQYFYDARNRVTDMDDPMVNDATVPHRNSDGHTVSWILDQTSNKVSQRNANNQVTTFDSYDPINRLLQQTVQQSPNPAAVTTYTYYPSGLLQFMKDPHLVEIGSSYAYGHTYDLMGRTTRVAYPPDSGFNLRSEWGTYDTVGNLATYTNRAGNIQTFTYDGRNRATGFSWNDGTTPSQTMAYDPASRITQISNADAVINNVYFNDDLLKSQEEWATADAGNHRTVTYAYNTDGNRSSITYPSGIAFTNEYNGRNELVSVYDSGTSMNYAYYIRDLNGNVSTRYAGHHWALTDASQRNSMGQVKHLEHQFVGTTRTLDYSYDAMGNRTSIQRDGGTAESYGYDQAQQVTAGRESGNPSTYSYDANGNRTALNGGGSYATNSLNQQTTFNGNAVTYEPKGNVATYTTSASYVYDAQTRLKSVTIDGLTTSFKYDGLNRKISQTIGAFTTYNVWDDWNLIEERGAGNALNSSYIYGAGEIVERISNGAWYIYFQDGLGSTSHVSDLSRNLLESYKYTSTFGSVSVYSPTGVIRKNGSSYDVRHLFTGQLWMPQIGLYDYRNRVYSPGLARFLQPDPIGFAGDPTNLYRYCGNNPVNSTDPFGLTPPAPTYQHLNGNDIPTATMPGIVVRDTEIRELGPLDRSGGAHGEGSRGDGGGNGGRMGSRGWYAQDANGRIYVPRTDNFGPDATGTTDRIIAEILGEPVGPWGEHEARPLDYGPNDRGSAPGGGSRGAGNPYRDSAPFIAEIGRGFDSRGLRQTARFFNGVGTAAAVIVAAPVLIPLAGDALPVLAHAGRQGGIRVANAYLTNPMGWTHFGQALVPGMGGASASYYGAAGYAVRQGYRWWSE